MFCPPLEPNPGCATEYKISNYVSKNCTVSIYYVLYLCIYVLYLWVEFQDLYKDIMYSYYLDFTSTIHGDKNKSPAAGVLLE